MLPAFLYTTHFDNVSSIKLALHRVLVKHFFLDLMPCKGGHVYYQKEGIQYLLHNYCTCMFS